MPGKTILLRVVGALSIAVAMVGCGGGGGGGGGAAPASTPTVTGVAASGAAIASAQITITGAKGNIVTVTTGTDGSYSADVSSLTAPYLVKVVPATGPVLYSVGTAAGIVNIHPLTDLIVRTWYQVQGTDAATAFASPASNPAPTAKQVAVVAAVVEKIVDKWLVAKGIDPTQFNLFTTSFKADSTGFDALLDTLTVDDTTPSAPVISVNAGTDGTQTTNVTVAAGGSITVNTSITVNAITSTSFTTAFVPTSSASETALNGVLATLSSMANVINTQGANLAASDILPFVDTNYLGGGKNASQFAAGLASDMAGVTLDGFTVSNILSFDSTNNIIAVEGQLTATVNGQQVVKSTKGNNGDGLFFKLESDGSWKFYGDQQRVKVNLKVETSQRMAGTGTGCTSGCDGVYYDLQVQLVAPTGTVTSATVTGNIGGSTQNSVPMTLESGTYTDNGIITDHIDLLGGSGGTFYGLTSPTQFPVAGSSYAIHVVFADTSTADYTAVLGASTTEPMTLQTGVETTVGHSASASLGQPITLSWNLPLSFPIATVEMYASVTDTNGNTCDTSGPSLAATATTGTMTLPNTCNGLSLSTSPAYPSISVVVTGTSGESTNIWYAFQ